MENSDNKVLHIYGQDAWHDAAYIIGTKEALVELRNGIDEALKNDMSKVVVWPADGEGFELFLIVRTSDQMEQLMLPYFSDSCPKGGKGPWELKWAWDDGELK